MQFFNSKVKCYMLVLMMVMMTQKAQEHPGVVGSVQAPVWGGQALCTWGGASDPSLMKDPLCEGRGCVWHTADAQEASVERLSSFWFFGPHGGEAFSFARQLGEEGGLRMNV